MEPKTNHRRRLFGRGRGFKPRGKHFSSTTESVDTRTSTKSTRTTADNTFLQLGHKPRDEEKGSVENKQFDRGGKGEKAPLWNAAVTLPFLFCGERWAMEGSLLVLHVFLSVCVLFLSALFPKLLFFPGDHFSAS